jgi:hypothetical protein
LKTILIRFGLAIFLIFNLFIVISCSSAITEIVGEWQSENYQKGNVDKVLILGIFNKDRTLLRRNFENGMTNAFISMGIAAIPSTDFMPYDVVIDSTTFEKYFEDLDVDAVVVSRLVGIDQSRNYEAGYQYTIPFDNYNDFYGYYYSGIEYANSSGYLTDNVVVVLETNIYETKDKKLIWSGISETIDPDNVSDVIKSFGNKLVSKLKQEGYFK